MEELDRERKFKQLVHAYGRSMEKVIFDRVGLQALEDVYQRALLVLWNQTPSINFKGNPRSYCYSISRTVCEWHNASQRAKKNQPTNPNTLKGNDEFGKDYFGNFPDHSGINPEQRYSAQELAFLKTRIISTIKGFLTVEERVLFESDIEEMNESETREYLKINGVKKERKDWRHIRSRYKKIISFIYGLEINSQIPLVNGLLTREFEDRNYWLSDKVLSHELGVFPPRDVTLVRRVWEIPKPDIRRKEYQKGRRKPFLVDLKKPVYLEGIAIKQAIGF